MSLPTGSRLGPYEILAPLGAGGMGEVYRAQDPRLGRDVAVKALPAELAHDQARRRRFEQEARAASALNHPNIVVVYDVGVDNGVPYMVTELVEGGSLRQAMAGPMPVRRLLDVAVQVADGLAAAHAAGITHRDLKPENILLTRDERPKIADFGLAKMGVGGREPGAGETALPTAAGLTHEGMILGTVNYMSPEQARGATVDFRSDQFSFGVLLYELATGKKAFDRGTTVQTLSAILTDETPPIDARIPPPLRWAIDRCLAKEPGHRYDSTRDLYQELRSLRDHLSEAFTAEVPVPVVRRSKTPLFSAIGIAGALALGILTSQLWLGKRTIDLAQYRFTPLVTNHPSQGSGVWSPDGKSFAYAALVEGVGQIFARSLDSPAAVQLTRGSTGAYSPFWSQDSRRVFFLRGWYQSAGLWSVATAGGAPEEVLPDMQRAAISPDNKTLALLRGSGLDAALWISSPPGSPPRKYQPAFEAKLILNSPRMQFAPDGRKLLLAINRGQGEELVLFSFPDGSSSPRSVLPAVRSSAATPSFSWMPDSRHIVFSFQPRSDRLSQICMADTESGAWWALTAGEAYQSEPAVSPDGRKIIYTVTQRDFDLMEAPLDGGPPRTLLATGRLEGMPAWAPVHQQFVFVTNRAGPEEIWLKSRQEGWERPVVSPKDFPQGQTMGLIAPVFSPDGQRIAYTRAGADGISIWISSLSGGAPMRLTSEDAIEVPPSWSPDGDWLAYVRIRAASPVALVKAKLGSREAPTVLKEGLPGFVPQWSPSGEWIAGRLSGDTYGLFSPDGKSTRVLGKSSDVVLFWSKDGKVLYGVRREEGRGKLFSVDIAAGKEKMIGDLGDAVPATWSNPGLRLTLAPDGKTFAYSVSKSRGDLWLLEGFEQPPGLLARLALRLQR